MKEYLLSLLYILWLVFLQYFVKDYIITDQLLVLIANILITMLFWLIMIYKKVQGKTNE